MNSKLSINDIQCYAYHGCLPEEEVIGGLYRVDVEIEMDFSKPMRTDELRDTLDYVLVYRIVKEQMAIPSRLIEHVCGRILEALHRAMPGPKKFRVTVTKYNPPVNGSVGDTAFTSEIAYNE